MLLKIDLDHVLENTVQLWPALQNARIFITGGTGFVGKWLLETLIYANVHFNLGIKAVVLTRNREGFRRDFPHLADNNIISLYQGDIRTFQLPEENFTHVIHGATDVSTQQSSLTTYDTIANGTKRVLDFCQKRNISDILLISSGAVSATYPQTAYAEGKRTAEWFANIYNSEFGLKCRIARCFAFVGPYLPLTGPFAVGNFVANLIRGESIKIKGDGTAIRSYLYAADLAIWLWTIFIHGTPSVPYNVGSDEEMSIRELASRVAHLESPASDIEILTHTRSSELTDRYVPSIQLARENLGLQIKISVNDALLRMVNWARNHDTHLIDK